MKRFSLLAITAMAFLTSYSQQKDFLLKRPLLRSVDSIEHANKGEEFNASFKISVSGNYFPNADKFNLAGPRIFFRKGNSFTIEMNYYYSIPDSIIRLVSYSWEGDPKRTAELNSLFENNATFFSGYFKQPGEIKNEPHDTWSQKSVTWQNDIVYVNQFMVWGQTTNRVRVLISWK